jgi:hypothetical protein
MNEQQSDPNWWRGWRKPDGSECNRWEVLRMLAAWRRRNRQILHAVAAGTATVTKGATI